jgi:hypothetical protein
MLGFPIALVIANGVEWYTHKYVLHGLPRKQSDRQIRTTRRSPIPRLMRGHWAHHKTVRQQGYLDTMYQRAYGSGDQHRDDEVNGLLVLCLIGSLPAPLAPGFTLGVYYSAWNYHRTHRRSHLDPEWGKRHAPWHYDHHMNPDQDANWCVTKPWFDYLMGTRVAREIRITETNPIGIRLPAPLESAVNRLATRLGLQPFQATRQTPL